MSDDPGVDVSKGSKGCGAARRVVSPWPRMAISLYVMLGIGLFEPSVFPFSLYKSIT